tara:strand:+ start:2636 stop:2746 length:111 start_codon:yes stop_codon:yes gene_type:complete
MMFAPFSVGDVSFLLNVLAGMLTRALLWCEQQKSDL